MPKEKLITNSVGGSYYMTITYDGIRGRWTQQPTIVDCYKKLGLFKTTKADDARHCKLWYIPDNSKFNCVDDMNGTPYHRPDFRLGSDNKTEICGVLISAQHCESQIHKNLQKLV